MPFSDQSEYPRSTAYGVNVFGTPLVVQAADTGIKVSHIVFSNRAGTNRTVIVTNADDDANYFTVAVPLQSTFIMPRGFQVADGLRFEADGSAVDITVFYFTA